MNVLIIYAHPHCQSFSEAILKKVQAGLSKVHTVTLLDLYAEQFDPVLRFDKCNKTQTLSKSAEIEKYRTLVAQADHMIFIFPIWWSGMPAMLKGFIDRIFAKGFAYSYKKVGLEGHLQGKSAWIIATHNTPSLAMPFVQDYGKVLKKQILKPCGIAPVRLTRLANTEKITDEKRERFLEEIRHIACHL